MSTKANKFLDKHIRASLEKGFYFRWDSGEDYMNYIKINELVDGGIYLIGARNFVYGLWNKKTNGFIGIREKFGAKFLFTEYHWDIGDIEEGMRNFGTARPWKLLKTLGEEIERKEYFVEMLENQPLRQELEKIPTEFKAELEKFVLREGEYA